MPKLIIFGLGYTAGRIADALRPQGWQINATGSAGDLDFSAEDQVNHALSDASHILSSVPPLREGGTDPVIGQYGGAFAGKHLFYLSSTGVYGDTKGAWVDESAPIGGGRRATRAKCDTQWLGLGARVFRLPGIYGPGRSAIERVQSGKASRIDLPGQVFSRIHVDDIVSGVAKAIQCEAPPGAYNLADDLPTSQNEVVEEACRLLNMEPPAIKTLDQANLSPAARAFYSENRRIANGKARRILGWAPKYPTYREGLRSMIAA